MTTVSNCLLLLLVSSAAMAADPFSYDAQDEWPGICVAGNQGRQSPIDIITEDVDGDRDLLPLTFSDSWEDESFSGSFFPFEGHNVLLFPNYTATGTSPPTITNHLGTYR